MKTYVITAGTEPGHYVVAMQKASGNMRVYDCRSKPDGDNWDPECRKAKMKNSSSGGITGHADE